MNIYRCVGMRPHASARAVSRSTYIRIYTHTYTYTYVHTYIHAHTHTRMAAGMWVCALMYQFQ